MFGGITHGVVTVVRVVHQHAPALLRRHLAPVASCLVLPRRRLSELSRCDLSRCMTYHGVTYHGDLSRWYAGWGVCEHSGERPAVVALSRCFRRLFLFSYKLKFKYFLIFYPCKTAVLGPLRLSPMAFRIP